MRRIRDAGGQAIAVPTNLAKDVEVERMITSTVEQLGPVDILVNNAAITFPGDLDLDMKRFDLVDAGRPASPAARDPGRDAVDEGAAHGVDPEHLVDCRARTTSPA